MKKTELAKKTVAELRSLAKAGGLKGYSGLRKSELIERLAAGARSDGRKQAAPARGVKERGADRGGATARRKRPRGSAGRETAAQKKSAPPRRRASGGQDLESIAGRGLSPRTRRAFSLYRALGEQRVKASKYYLGVHESPELDEDFTFPDTHGENVVFLMVRDPYWLFAYWEFSPDLDAELRASVGEEALLRSRLVLRVYDVTESGVGDSPGYHDIDVSPGARDWYVNVTRVERDYRVDIGIVLPDGSFVVIARSNCVSLPPIGPSDEVDERWVTLESLEEIYTLAERGPVSGSGGWGSGGWGRD